MGVLCVYYSNMCGSICGLCMCLLKDVKRKVDVWRYALSMCVCMGETMCGRMSMLCVCGV